MKYITTILFSVVLLSCNTSKKSIPINTDTVYIYDTVYIPVPTPNNHLFDYDSLITTNRELHTINDKLLETNKELLQNNTKLKSDNNQIASDLVLEKLKYKNLEYYVNIVIKDNSQAKFLKSWKSRIK